MRRMAGYLRNAHPTSPEQIADEMLAILEARHRWVEQKISQRANDSITAFYNRTRDEEVDRVLELGASLVADRRNADGSGWVVLADPEGNEFCVLSSRES